MIIDDTTISMIIAHLVPCVYKIKVGRFQNKSKILLPFYAYKSKIYLLRLTSSSSIVSDVVMILEFAWKPLCVVIISVNSADRSTFQEHLATSYRHLRLLMNQYHRNIQSSVLPDTYYHQGLQVPSDL